jgi:hypothetical protein
VESAPYSVPGQIEKRSAFYLNQQLKIQIKMWPGICNPLTNEANKYTELYMKTFASITFIALLASPLALAQDCQHEKDLSFTVDADGIEQITLNVGAGYLRINGDESATQIQVNARACANPEERLDGLNLEHRLRAGELQIDTDADAYVGLKLIGSNYARIDLDIIIPQNMAMSIEDGSGDIEIRNLAGNVSINDGSGEIELAGIAGDIDINDGSGDINVTDITGSVRVEDGSGSVSIRRVSGDVVIPDDGSGSLRIADVGGDVLIENDGSGSIRVDNVEGDFIALDTGSGSLNFSGITGRVQVRE